MSSVRHLSWPQLLLKLTSRDHPNARLTILETVCFDPQTLRAHLWVHTDSLGFLRRLERRVVVRSDLTAVCLRSVKTVPEVFRR